MVSSLTSPPSVVRHAAGVGAVTDSEKAVSTTLTIVGSMPAGHRAAQATFTWPSVVRPLRTRTDAAITGLRLGPMAQTESMIEPGATRVAVYLDFDNIVISRYDQVNGRNSFQKDKASGLEPEKLER